MIIATPDGKFFSEGWSELDGYRRRVKKITREYASHLCTKSQDYVVHRPLTLREKIMVLLGNEEDER